MKRNGKALATLFYRIFICLLLGCLLSQEMASQESIRQKKSEYAFFTGYGHSFSLKVSYVHHMTSMQFQYYSQMKHPAWQVVFQPQFNLFNYKKENKENSYQNGYELGLNFNLLWRTRRKDGSTRFYFQAGAGPHFLSKDLSRQSGGFIICSNIYFGYSIPLNDHLYLDFRPGFRHISNAEIRLPNGGINNLIWSVGLRW